MSICTRARVAIAGVGIFALLSVGTASTTPTDAEWTTAEYARSGAITAATMTTPAITSCVPSASGPLGRVFESVTITWTSDLPASSQRVYIGTMLGAAPVSSTGPIGGTYTHTTTYQNSGLLASVLTLLGGTTTIRVQAVAGDNWSSAAASRTLTVSLLGLVAPKCA